MHRLVVVSVFILSLAGCAALRPLPAIDLAYHGVWQSDGYGYLVDIAADRARLFHITPAQCLPAEDGADDVHRFLAEHPPELTDGGERMRIGEPGDAWGVPVRRRARLPVACDAPTPRGAVANFAAFADFFSAHYAFFDLYGVDWAKTVEAMRPRIEDGMSDAALFGVFREMLAPLRDGHVTLRGRVDGDDVEYEPHEGETVSRLRAQAADRGILFDRYAGQFLKRHWMTGVRQTLLGGEGRLGGDRLIQYGMLDEAVGYLGLLTMAGFSGNRDIGFTDAADDYRVFDAVLDEAMDSFAQRGARAVVVDLSVNFGGFDRIGRELAARFASRKTLAYEKWPGDFPGAEPFALFVEPNSRPGFSGPVYVLTSDITVSAGETATMALRALPGVTHLGSTTRGALSDVLDKSLPNGWEISLSNEVYRDSDGVMWEGRGIAPQVPLTVFDPADPHRGHVEAVRRVQARARRDLGLR